MRSREQRQRASTGWVSKTLTPSSWNRRNNRRCGDSAGSNLRNKFQEQVGRDDSQTLQDICVAGCVQYRNRGFRRDVDSAQVGAIFKQFPALSVRFPLHVMVFDGL